MKIAIGSDHGGFNLKHLLVEELEERGITIEDHGCFGTESADYPDHAAAVAADVSQGRADQGIIVCKSGIGMSITANKFPGVRAALCVNTETTRLSREHNNANVLCLGSLHTDESKQRISSPYGSNCICWDRHKRRINKINSHASEVDGTLTIRQSDPAIYKLLQQEDQRQKENIELIASENITSKAVREVQGSRMTNKYAEGYPGKRWYNGCEWVDGAETLAIERAKELFGAEHANVQPHSGSGANMAVYFSQLQPGDTILAMSLAERRSPHPRSPHELFRTPLQYCSLWCESRNRTD